MDALPPRNVWRVRRETVFPNCSRGDGLVEGGIDALPVRITVVQDGWVTGWDDGALGFEEDAVWFSGEATSFRVFASDIWSARLNRRHASRMTDGEVLSHGLPLRHPRRELRICIRVLMAADRWHHRDLGCLAAEIRRLWLLGLARGESHYPPLVPRPGADIVSPDEWSMREWISSNPTSRSLGYLLRTLVWRPSPSSWWAIEAFRRGLVEEDAT